MLGLLKHSAVWEARWFQGVVANRAVHDGWPERKSPIPDEDFLVDEDTVDAYAAIHRPAFEAMGFKRFKPRVWLLTDWVIFDQQLEALRSRFGIEDDLTELVLRGEKW